MDEATLPFSKSWSFIPEDCSIPLQPNVSTSHNEHFHEKNMSKTSFGPSNGGLDVISSRPLNLQIIPNTLAEIASEEKMMPILINSQRT